jgi:hypothetical protein
MFKIIYIVATFFIHTILYKTASSNMRTYSIKRWDIDGQNYINKGCRYDINNKCTGFCPTTLKKCEELVNFNTKVCGCGYCKFNTITKRCNGQCGNLILETCISKVDQPTKDSDCACSSCKAAWITIHNDDYGYDEEYPSCNEATCHVHGCEAHYISANGEKNDTLYCSCNSL